MSYCITLGRVNTHRRYCYVDKAAQRNQEFKIPSQEKEFVATICSNMSHKITIISFYILRIFMTVFTISEYFIGHTLLQAVSYILKRRGNSLQESAWVGWGTEDTSDLRQRSGMSGMSELSGGDNRLSVRSSLIYRHHHHRAQSRQQTMPNVCVSPSSLSSITIYNPLFWPK